MQQHFICEIPANGEHATPERRRSHWPLIVILIVAACFVLAAAAVYGSIAPSDFSSGTIVNISSGATLNQIAGSLKANRIIRSTFIFKAYTLLVGDTTGLRTGQYLFTDPQSALRVAYRLIHGQEGFPLVKVTIQEGLTSSNIAVIIAKAIPDFDKAGFLKLAKPDEGYLFPDTYFWPTNLAPSEAASDMRSIFDDKLQTVQGDLAAFGKPQKDVIAMASIVEKEATSSTDRRIVAGILWKRLAAGMALQVDPPFEYFLNKPAGKLTSADIKTESPYNLYLHTGLPPTPIDNPGLSTILDTVNPTTTKYWFYISDKNGVMHYATTLEGHNANIEKYLN
jgi:UPF0755 protein